MAVEPGRLLTHEEYFALERETGRRYEYVAGRVYPVGEPPPAMKDNPTAHGLISVNTSASLNVQLRAKPYRVYSSAARVAMQQFGVYAYPDISVVRGEPQLDESGGGITNPAVLIEVLTPAIVQHEDRRFSYYQQIPSLQAHVVIDQQIPFVRALARDEQGRWIWSAAEGLDATLPLASIDCELPLAEVYVKVQFETTEW